MWSQKQRPEYFDWPTHPISRRRWIWRIWICWNIHFWHSANIPSVLYCNWGRRCAHDRSRCWKECQIQMNQRQEIFGGLNCEWKSDRMLVRLAAMWFWDILKLQAFRRFLMIFPIYSNFTIQSALIRCLFILVSVTMFAFYLPLEQLQWSMHNLQWVKGPISNLQA